MKSFSVSFPIKAKEFLQKKASKEGVTIEKVLLQSVGWENENDKNTSIYTSDDLRDKTLEDVSQNKRYTVDEAIAEMETW